MSTKKVPVSDNEPIVKYKVLCSKKYGRYLVAEKKIEAGEIIIREKPVIIGPGICTDDNRHSCFECLKIIPTAIGNTNISCSNCQVAIFCSGTCKARNSYHTSEECEILKNKTIPFRMKDILFPLRLWLIKKHDEGLWEKISRLEAHLEARRDTDIWRLYERKVMNTLKSLGIVDKSEENNFPELIQRICGILDVNSFGILSPDDFSASADSGVRGLYLEASLMAHSCQGNTYSTFDDELHLTIQASKPIDDGEIIFYNYTFLLLSMAERRKQLRETMYFECDCPMCEDPHELGTNLSIMFCPHCNDGLIIFASEKTKNPYVKEKNWKCNKCRISWSGYLIAFYLYLVKMRINLVKNSIAELEVLLKKLSSTFHPNHFLMMDIKCRLFALHKIKMGCPSSREKIFNRVIEIGTDMLKIIEIVEPGISGHKGTILYSIYKADFYLKNRDPAILALSSEEFVKILEKMMKNLKRSLAMLQYAPASTPEGFLAKRVLQEIEAIRQGKDTITRHLINKNKK